LYELVAKDLFKLLFSDGIANDRRYGLYRGCTSPSIKKRLLTEVVALMHLAYLQPVLLNHNLALSDYIELVSGIALGHNSSTRLELDLNQILDHAILLFPSQAIENRYRVDKLFLIFVGVL
jgi:hypothetical protein